MEKYTYEILSEGTINEVILRSDGACIPKSEANSDYQRYLAWLENPEAEQSTPSVTNGD
jgi:hypothetical protein